MSTWYLEEGLYAKAATFFAAGEAAIDAHRYADALASLREGIRLVNLAAKSACCCSVAVAPTSAIRCLTHTTLPHAKLQRMATRRG